jgi:hypothetical protein
MLFVSTIKACRLVNWIRKTRHNCFLLVRNTSLWQSQTHTERERTNKWNPKSSSTHTGKRRFQNWLQKSLHIDKRRNYKHMHTEHSILKIFLEVLRVEQRLETLFWAYFVLGFLKTESCELFAQAGFKLPAPWFLPSNYPRLQSWTTRAQMTPQFTKEMLMCIQAHSDHTQQL